MAFYKRQMFPLNRHSVKRGYQVHVIILTGVICAAVWWIPARSQEAETVVEEATTEQVEVPPTVSSNIDPTAAITTASINIPVDELKLLVQPLTLEELEIEAAAWLAILQAKVKEISAAEIAIKQANAAIAKEQEGATALEQAKQALEEAEVAQANAVPGSPEAEEAAKKVEEAKEKLAAAQAALEEATELKEEVESDEESTAALERATEVEELQKAQEVLDEAKKAREEMTAGSVTYDSQTERIDALTAAVADLEKAKEESQDLVPDTPEYEEATTRIEAFRSNLRKAIRDLDPDALPEVEEEKPSEKLDELSSLLEDTEVGDGEAKVAGPAEVGGSETDVEQQQQQIEEAAEELQENAETEAEKKNQLVVAVTQLQGERTGIIDRFNVILDELEKKGGDGEFYRKYIQAVSGIELDISDTDGLGVRAVSWLQSEEGGLRWMQNISKFLGVFIVALLGFQIAGIAVDYGLARFSRTSQLLRQFLVIVIKRGGILVAFLLALTALEVSLGPVLALLGGVSFVLAFALQSNLGNLASGLMIMVYKPFDVGDEVRVQDLWGYIYSINLANTQIKGFDHQIITIPNNTIWGSIIENLTTQEVRRAKVPISVPFDTDLRRVKALLIEIGKSHPLTIKEKGLSAYIWKGRDYYIHTGLKFWATADDFWTVYEDLTFIIQERFREEGIPIAIPQQDIRLHYAPNGNGNGKPPLSDSTSTVHSLESLLPHDQAEPPMDETENETETFAGGETE